MMFKRFNTKKTVVSDTSGSNYLMPTGPVKRSEDIFKVSNSFPRHLEMRNNHDFKQNDFKQMERLPTDANTFLSRCTAGKSNASAIGQDKDLVIKIIAKDESMLSADQKARFNREILILWTLRKSNAIAKLVGYSRNPVGLILKEYKYNSLAHWIWSSSQSPPGFRYSKEACYCIDWENSNASSTTATRCCNFRTSRWDTWSIGQLSRTRTQWCCPCSWFGIINYMPRWISRFCSTTTATRTFAISGCNM